MYLVGAGVAQVRIARGVVRDDVDYPVLKGADYALCIRILLEIDDVQRKFAVQRIGVIGDERRLVFIIHIRAAAERLLFVHAAIGDDRYVQQLYKLRIADAEVHIEVLRVVVCALIAGKPAAESVRVYSALKGIAQILAGDGGAVMKGVPGIYGKAP